MFSLVVGKLCPLHSGHLYLLKHALQHSQKLCVLSYTSLEVPGCEAQHRQAWLEECLRDDREKVHIHVLDPSRCPVDEAPADIHRTFCAQLMCRWGYEIDAVFTSERYGSGFAQVLSETLTRPVQHICLDLERTTVPFSGTRARALLELFWKAPQSTAGQEARHTLKTSLPDPVFTSLTQSNALSSPTQEVSP